MDAVMHLVSAMSLEQRSYLPKTCSWWLQCMIGRIGSFKVDDNRFGGDPRFFGVDVAHRLGATFTGDSTPWRTPLFNLIRPGYVPIYSVCHYVHAFLFSPYSLFGWLA